MVLSNTSKKLLLAPAVTALALSGLIAAPAFAETNAPAGSTQEATATPKAEATPTGSASAASTRLAKLVAGITQSDLEKTGTPVTFDILSGVSPLNQTFTTTFTDSKGKTVAGSSVKTDAKGHYEGPVKASALVAPGDAKLNFFYKGSKVGGAEISITVLADAPKPDVTFSTKTDFPKVSGENLAPNTPVKVTLVNKKTGNDFPQDDTLTTDAKGAFGPYAVSPQSGPWPDSAWTVTVTVGGYTEKEDFTIGDGVAATVTAPSKVSLSALTKDGLKVKGAHFDANESVEVGFVIDGAQSSGDTKVIKADKNGAFSSAVKLDNKYIPGKYTFVAFGHESGEQATAKVTVTKDAPTITASPKKVSASDFENAKKGVTIKATGYEAGESVTATATQTDGKVKKFTLEATADDNGAVSFKLYALGKSVLGKYNVSLAGDETAGTLTTSFSVVADSSNAGGSGSDDNSSDPTAGGSGDDSEPASNELPRTGGVGGFGAGAALLALGAGAVVVSRRRSKVSADPTDV